MGRIELSFVRQLENLHGLLRGARCTVLSDAARS
jgi:hypothetical protein